ncbi:MAG: metallophosphoesterase [Clostridia bacterium]|nr:metallophosphoesterase [Clostridia bacterium]
MSLYAIGDLHLPGGDDKPMNVFGDHWEGHFDRIAADWRARVGEADTVLIPGDISWAMQLRDAAPDLAAIGELPGRKLIIKGNHDYWWNTLKQVRSVLPQGMEAIQHTAVDVGDCIVCGTRGWTIPTRDAPLSVEDARLCAREVMRLELALQAAVSIAGDKPIVVMMHYPPLYEEERDTPFTQLLAKYPVHTVVYGHLHGAGIRVGFNGQHEGVRYRLTSCDSLGFSLAEIPLEVENLTN